MSQGESRHPLEGNVFQLPKCPSPTAPELDEQGGSSELCLHRKSPLVPPPRYWGTLLLYQALPPLFLLEGSPAAQTKGTSDCPTTQDPDLGDFLRCGRRDSVPSWLRAVALMAGLACSPPGTPCPARPQALFVPRAQAAEPLQYQGPGDPRGPFLLAVILNAQIIHTRVQRKRITLNYTYPSIFPKTQLYDTVM